MSITRTLIATLAIAALAAPAARAQPADMHASVAQAAAKAHQKQDLRHLRAGGAATKHEQDARPHEQNVGAYTPSAIPAVSYPSGGAYTPGAIPAVSYPRPVVAARAVQAPDNSGGVSATTIGLGIAGSLLAISAIAGMMKRSRRTGRARVAA
jgi:Ni/Co efflux regulator RcnB